MQRNLLVFTMFVSMLALPSAARAQHAQIGGFGGLTFGDVANDTTFGGGLAVSLTDNIQIIGEGGRMTDVMPALADTLLDLTPVDVRVSALYAEGGLRIIGPSRSAVRPYVEATAGIARLRTGFSGIADVDPIINGALGLFDRNEPLIGAGGGVIVQGGPVYLDLGYRYKRIMAGNSLQSLLTGGEFGVNSVRFGLGIRF